MADTVYNVFKAGLPAGTHVWESTEYSSLLLTGSLTINPDHATVAAVVAANTEASDGSYGRVDLASNAVTQNDAADRAELDTATIDFGALDNETPTAIVIFKENGTDTGRIPVSLHDSGFGAAANGAGYEVQWPNDVIRIS